MDEIAVVLGRLGELPGRLGNVVEKAHGQRLIGNLAVASGARAISPDMVDLGGVERSGKFEVMADGRKLFSVFINDLRPIVVQAFDGFHLRACAIRKYLSGNCFQIDEMALIPRPSGTDPQPHSLGGSMTRFAGAGVLGHRMRLSWAHVDG